MSWPTVSVLPPPLPRLSVVPSAIVSVPPPSVPLPVLLVMVALPEAVTVLVTFAPPTMSSVLAPSAMVALPAPLSLASLSVVFAATLVPPS